VSQSKRLYRVEATYRDGTIWRRDYQSKQAAQERKKRLEEGYEMETGDYTSPETTVVPPALAVTITPSEPIVWMALT
jgi:hypothetical protein